MKSPHTLTTLIKLTVLATSIAVSNAWSAPVVFNGSGAGATTALDAFRSAIGGVKNTAAAAQVGGRRKLTGTALSWTAPT